MAEKRELSAYQQKLLDPRWQKKRLQILERDEFACQMCFDATSTLHVHHRYYERGRNPWDYPDGAFLTLCETCHEEEGDMRPVVEQELLHALRQHFTAGEVGAIAAGFRDLKMVHISDVVASAIALLLTNRVEMVRAVELLFEENKRRRLERDKETPG